MYLGSSAHRHTHKHTHSAPRGMQSWKGSPSQEVFQEGANFLHGKEIPMGQVLLYAQGPFRAAIVPTGPGGYQKEVGEAL